ncbi:hypothetical protein LIER_41509 [Lithospermum erythrorhizon]|uniref:Uncharacterized protein n=1 Tax=Lithospermum erythrorhizon TaxID=34254 RepID=A0AAV3RE27_LITER
MNPTSISLLTSASIKGTNSGRNRRWPCLRGREPFLTDKWCTTILGFSPNILEYVQAKTSPNSVSRDTYSTSFSGVKRAMTYVVRGSSMVPRLISFSSSTVALTCSSSPRGASIASSGCASSSSDVMWNVAFVPSHWPLGRHTFLFREVDFNLLVLRPRSLGF